jgi:hypothetical protein
MSVFRCVATARALALLGRVAPARDPDKVLVPGELPLTQSVVEQ